MTVRLSLKHVSGTRETGSGVSVMSGPSIFFFFLTFVC